MHRCYSDILELTDKQPIWFDEYAVPRFCAFSPDCVDIYADEVVLFLIRCQSCGHEFSVIACQGGFDVQISSYAEAITEKELHYGDPPNIGCCSAGPTMNSEPVRVLEYWRRASKQQAWQRDPKFEIELT